MSISKYFDPEKIEIVKEIFGEKKKFNPRTLINKGFTSERMEELKKGIQLDGLNSPLLVRMDGEIPKLIAGERRLRAIFMLLEADREAVKKNSDRVLVKNPKTNKLEPALKVYKEEGVECRISDASTEKEWIRQAIQENTLHEPLTDYELLLQCQMMEESGLSRAEQAESIGKSEAWISQSHTLMSDEIHPKILEYMEKGLLGRTAALTFMGMDLEKQLSALERVIYMTYSQADEKIKEVEEELKQAEKDYVIGEKKLELSKFTGNAASKNKAAQEMQRAHRKKTKAEDKLKKLKETRGHATVEDVESAVKEVGKDDLNKPLSMKIVRSILTGIDQDLENGDKYIQVGDEQIDVRDAELVAGILGWVLGLKKYEHPFKIVVDLNNE